MTEIMSVENIAGQGGCQSEMRSCIASELLLPGVRLKS